MRVLTSASLAILALAATQGISAQRGNGRPVTAAAARAANSRFAGVWQLVGEETRNGTGQVVQNAPAVPGGSRFGYIAYDPAGYVGVTIAWPARPKFADRQPTAAEALAAMNSYNSYWGSFAVDEGRGVVTHQTFGALSPAFAGTNQERLFTITGKRLTLQPPAAANGDRRTLSWERVPDLPQLTPTHHKLIGFWKLISFEGRAASGELLWSTPGQTGFIVYTASGHVMVHMMQPYRRRNVGTAPTPEETMATYQTYTSYFGPYTVNESEQQVVHHLASSLNPNVTGSDFQRTLEFSGRRLTLKAPVASDSTGRRVQMVITWERLSE
jgi:hypothetical protein